MTPFQMLDVLDSAVVGPKGRRGSVLELRNPVVQILDCTERGKYLGRDPSDGAAVYGYTRRQCRRLRQAILTAAREDYQRLGPGAET